MGWGLLSIIIKIMSKLNLNPADTLQNALPETYTEKELLNCLEIDMEKSYICGTI